MSKINVEKKRQEGREQNDGNFLEIFEDCTLLVKILGLNFECPKTVSSFHDLFLF